MMELEAFDPARIAANLERVRERAPGAEIMAATKYVPLEEMGALAEAGIELVGENRLQDLQAKHERWGDSFTWDFIGTVQSRKVKGIVPLVRLIHSIASDSALRKLAAHAGEVEEILVEVNLSGEESKAGIQPEELAAFIGRSPVPVTGLMTMPPYTEDPWASQPYFAKLAELASEHGLKRLSMGTSQDWEAAVAEGATILRLVSTLYA
jgi:PLP dependent protein